MMRSYARRGPAAVYWLLLPTPRSQRFRTVFGPVNQALRSAAQSFPGTVRLIDLGATFAPHGRFRARMRWRGKLRTVRQADGGHLSVAGPSIATELIVRQMRRDGLVGCPAPAPGARAGRPHARRSPGPPAGGPGRLF